MSTLRVNNLTNQANDGGIEFAVQPVIDGLAKAWVNFDGTGTVAIRDSYNVSSITDNGTGNYTVNFTTAMPDANYTTNVTCKQDESGGGTYVFGSFFAGSGATVANVFTTSSVRVTANIGNGLSMYDAVVMCVAVFR